MDRIIQILVDMFGWLLSLILASNWVDQLWLVSFAYDDSYHMGLSMALYKVLCDDHAGCLCIGQNQTSMSLWVLDH